MKRKLLALLLALSLLTGLSASALAAETAAVIRLTKTTGTVEISKSNGKSISLLANMRLYNGYHVETAEESYAWINLDDSKLLKEDAASEVEVRKDGKKLEVQLRSGNVFFDVAEPLEDDESLNIRTSTMVVGVRGTSGWIQVVDRWRTLVSVLEGTVECTVTDPITGQLKSAEIEGGETAECVVYPREQAKQRCDILMKKYPIAEIPGFVLTDLVRDMKLCDKIEELAGLDIPRDLASVAGGDPSGRTPDRESATAEVLGEADRREDKDEADLREKIEGIEKELEKQPDNISPSKPVEKPTTPAPETPDRDDSSDSGDSGDSGTTTPTPTPPPQTSGMKLTDVRVQALLDAGTSVAVAPNTNAADTTPKKNTLEVDTGLSVASGKTLDLQSGIDVEVYSGKALRVDGTLTADALMNNGTTTVTSGNTLRLRGNLTTSGTLTVTSTGRVVVDGTFTNSGTVTLTSGAAVLAKTFAPNAAPEGWEVSAETDADGYYSLTPSDGDTPAPEGHAVNFNADGGKWSDGSGEIATRTGEDGKIPVWPENPVYGIAPATASDGPGLEFVGWFDAEGQSYTAASTFTADVTLIAHWNGWLMDNDSKTLIVAGSAAETDYEMLSGPDWGSTVYYTGAPWEGPLDSGIIETIEIKEGTARIGNNAFLHAHNNFGEKYVDSKVAKVTIPNSVSSIGKSAFFNCTSLTGMIIPEGVSSIGDSAFYGCSSLPGVTIPEGVSSIGVFTFYGCSSLSGVTIPEGVSSIGESAFEDSGLTGVSIPASVSSIGDYAFYRCSKLESISVDTANPSYSSLNGVLFSKDQSTLTAFPPGRGGTYDIPTGVTSIGEYAFYSCTGLTGVTIPASVSSIGDYAFSRCTGLTGILTIPVGVSSIGGFAFSDCTGLTGVTIPASVSSIEPCAFSGCTGLTGTLTIPASVSSIGYQVFSGCTGLTSVTFAPDSKLTSIGSSAFYGCTGLTGTLTIPAGITSIGNSAFRGCTGLTGVSIPSSVTSIGDYVFSDCTSLTSVKIPLGVTSIEASAFHSCTGLTSVEIPTSVTSIENYAFYGCTSLNIYFTGSEEEWNNNVTKGSGAIPDRAAIHYNLNLPETPAP